MSSKTPLLLALAFITSSLLVEARRQAPTNDASANAPILYRVTFPEPEHHWMQVEVTFSKVRRPTLDLHMSRSSPGRYAVAEFAKNVFSVEAFNSKGQKVAYTRPEVDVWRIAGHDGTVRIVYKIFGDHANGTFFGSYRR